MYSSSEIKITEQNKNYSLLHLSVTRKLIDKDYLPIIFILKLDNM